MSLDVSDHALLASALAVALGLVKGLESLISWVVKRSRGKDSTSTTRVELSSEPSHMLREMHDRVGRIDDIVGLRDMDGVPLVYTQRSFVENQLKMAEAMRDLSKNQEQTLSHLDSINRKIDDALSFAKKQ